MISSLPLSFFCLINYGEFPDSSSLLFNQLSSPHSFFPKAAFICVITSLRSLALKMLLPATMQLAPLSTANSILSKFNPPSTWMSMLGSFCRIYFTFGIISSMNFCPPNPGSTVITKILSIRPSSARLISSGGSWVAGLMLTPTLVSEALTFSHNYLRLFVATS